MAAPLTAYYPLTGDRIVDGMTNGYFWNLDSTKFVDYSLSNGFQGQYWFNPSMVALYMGAALDTFSTYADIKFNYVGFFTTPIVASNYGSEINLGLSQTGKAFDSNNVWAFGVFPNSDSSVYYGYTGAPGDIYLNLSSPGASLPSYEPGSQGWFLLIHELLHTLGLKHPHDDGGTGRPTFTELGLGSLDINWATVMSYNDGAEWNNYSWKPATPMALDVLALQYLYGKNSTWNTTDTGYTLKETNFFYTLWDAGGIDTLDASTATSGWTIKLPNVALSTKLDTKVGFAAPTNDLSVGTPHTLVWLTGDYENITGSSYADIIDGNLFNNTINAGPGNDVMYGGLGNDTFDWDISKRSGNDTMYGGMGDDVFVLDSTGDNVIEYANEGNDSIWVDFSYSISSIENVENLFGYGINSLSLIGNNATNSFIGGKGNDTIDGGSGTDYVIYADNFADCSITPSGLNYTVKTKTEGMDSISNIEFLKFLDKTIDIAGLNSLPINITGTAFKDTFTSTYINEYVDGGEGIDTVIYSGIRSNYILTKGESAYTVTDKTGADGTDTLTNIERLVFSDFKEALGTTALNESEVQKLYIAYFNRPGDPGGLGYWEGLLANGASMTTLQNSFSSSAEYQAIYIGQQNTVLITKLYQNLFGRVVDVNDGGVQWWAGEMAAGRHTITTIAGALSSGTSPGSADNIAITNKIAAATAFTNALNTNAETENYVGAAAFAIASNWLAPIRDDNILATSLASRDTTIASAVAAKTVLVNATGTANASQGVVTFELAAASFDYTISGFGVGDRIDFAAGALPTLTNASYNDGQVNLIWSSESNNVVIQLVGLSGTQDSQLNTLADFNTVFGVGSVY